MLRKAGWAIAFLVTVSGLAILSFSLKQVEIAVPEPEAADEDIMLPEPVPSEKISEDELSDSRPRETETKAWPKSGAQAKAGGPSVEEIWLSHKPRFESLQKISLSRLDILLNAAMRDYEKYKTSKYKLMGIASRYYKAGLELEREADRDFETALSLLQADLISNSLPTLLVLEVKREYQEMKREFRQRIFEEVTQATSS